MIATFIKYYALIFILSIADFSFMLPILSYFLCVIGMGLVIDLFNFYMFFPTTTIPTSKYYLERKRIIQALNRAMELESTILVEGLNGSGKSTLCHHYANDLRKTRKVLFYSVGVFTDFENDLLRSITAGPFLFYLVLWWCKLSNQTILSFWVRAIIWYYRRETIQPVIFIDLGNEQERNDSLVQALFNLASKTCGVCKFVFITSNYGVHTVRTTNRYSLKSCSYVFVGCVEHEETVEYLNLVGIPPKLHNELLDICGNLLVHLRKCTTISEDEDLKYLREAIHIDIGDRLVRSGLDVNDETFRAFIKEILNLKNSRHEIEFKVLKRHFPTEEQLEKIIRGNVLYCCSYGMVHFQSNIILNHVLKRMNLNNEC